LGLCDPRHARSVSPSYKTSSLSHFRVWKIEASRTLLSFWAGFRIRQGSTSIWTVWTEAGPLKNVVALKLEWVWYFGVYDYRVRAYGLVYLVWLSVWRQCIPHAAAWHIPFMLTFVILMFLK
jgi:hypothetical protein